MKKEKPHGYSREAKNQTECGSAAFLHHLPTPVLSVSG
jgi:hypothetical protein